jgi:prepilin-type N-terminal cleavage/methylation domain-containing protein
MQTEIMKNRFGFTIMELMVVISITAIVAAIGAPSAVGYLDRKGVVDASDQLFADLYRTKSLAIKNRALATINFDLANQNYQVTFSDTSTGAVTVQSPVNLGDFRGDVIITTDPGSGAASAATIAFNHRGVCPAGSSGAVYLTNQGNFPVLRVRTTLAGGISIHRWNPSTGGWTTR